MRLSLLTILPLITTSSFGQCYVNAGPDIDVCQEGTVGLHGTYSGDVTHVEWTGGKGKFEPGRLFFETEYTPSGDEAGTTVTLRMVATLKAGAVGQSGVACQTEMTDDIELRVNQPVQSIAGTNMHLCAGDVKLSGKVKGNAETTTWVSNGTGTFDHANKLDAVYHPSEKDLADKAVSLTLQAKSYGFCGTDESTIILMFDKGISFTTEKEIFTSGTEAVTLVIDAEQKPAGVDWTSNGTGTFTKKNLKETTYTPSLEDTQKGNISLSVQVADPAQTCIAKRDVVLHFRGR